MDEPAVTDEPAAAAGKRTSGTERTRVLLLFGGRSSEHEVSCLSARSVLDALDRDRYAVTTVGITRNGRWTLLDGVPDAPEGALPSVPDDGESVALVQTRKGEVRLVRFPDDNAAGEEIATVDVSFPVLHGPYGEDGTVQGLLATLGVPYVGAGVAASAVGIDKRQQKDLLIARGLPQVAHRAVRRRRWNADPMGVLDDVEWALPGYPLFTKPACQGSSVGISKVTSREELAAGIEAALGHDRVVLVEQGLTDVRELECGVLGNAEVEVTPPGEVVTGHDFYDYEAKYLDAVDLRCPADVPDEIAERCRDLARRAYEAIGARGMARVDFFYRPGSGEVLVNEINTIPGFTPVSMYPYAWSVAGLSYAGLLDRLLDLAFESAHAEACYAP